MKNNNKKYSYTENFIKNDYPFLLANMMGPNAIRVGEELTFDLNITSKTKILDLGCGAGLTSIMLAEKFNAQVIAADLWIDPTANYKRFKRRGLEDKILPINLDITKGLPFAKNYFDLIFSVDAYHYFGATNKMLPFLVDYIKPQGHIAVAVPGLQKEFKDGTPKELKEFLPDNHNFHSLGFWQKLWSKTPNIQLENCQTMASHKKAWSEWLQSSNHYAQNDVKMMAKEKDNYFNHVQLIARRVKSII